MTLSTRAAIETIRTTNPIVSAAENWVVVELNNVDRVVPGVGAGRAVEMELHF